MNPRARQWIAHGSALLLGGVLIIAAVPKILDPAGFALDLLRQRMLPNRAVNLIALVLPWCELAIGGSLWLPGRTRREAAAAALCLLALFMGVGLLQAWKGIDAPCGCFGSAMSLPAGIRILMNAVLAALAAQAMCGGGTFRPGLLFDLKPET